MPFQRRLKSWLKEISQEKSPRTLSTYKSCVPFVEKWLDERDFTTLKSSDAWDYRDMLLEKEYAPSTINVYLSVAKSFFRHLLTRDHIEKNPFDGITSVKRAKGLPKPLTAHEVHLLREHTNSRYYFVFLTMLYAGLRASEIVNLTVEDIIWEDPVKITIRGGKGDKDRVTYIIDTIFGEELRDWIKNQTGKVFGIKDTSSIRYAVKRMKKHIPDFHSHRLRHTYATILVERGMPLEYVAELLGHATTATTKIYARISQTKIKESIKDFFS